MSLQEVAPSVSSLQSHINELFEDIRARQEALQTVGSDTPGRDSLLEDLASAIVKAYSVVAIPHLLEAAIASREDVLKLRPPGHPLRASALDNLGRVLWTYCERRCVDAARLDRCIIVFREAVKMRQTGDPARVAPLNNLANALGTSFSQQGGSQKLAEAISLYREALELCPLGNPDRDSCMNNLANALTTQFGQQGDKEALEEIMSLNRETLRSRPPGHPNRANTLNNLAQALFNSYERTGDAERFTEAISVLREAVELCPLGHPHRDMPLNGLGCALYTSFKNQGNVGALEEAIGLLRQALELRPPGHPLRHSSLTHVAHALHAHFERFSDTKALDDAISMLHEAMQLSPPGHPRRPLILTSLASALLRRYEQHDEAETLAEVTSLHRQALQLCPPGHLNRDGVMNDVANGLLTGFQRLGDVGALVECTSLYREVLLLRPPGHPLHDQALLNLASALLSRYDLEKDPEVLAEAITLFRNALALCPPGHIRRSYALNNLASALTTTFQDESKSAAITEAIALLEEALRLRAPGHPQRHSSLNNLGHALLCSSERGDEEDTGAIAKAVTMFRELLDLRPLGHPGRYQALMGLGLALRAKYDRQADPEILAEELSLYRTGLQLCLMGHPARARFLFEAAVCVLRPGTTLCSFVAGVSYIYDGLSDTGSPPTSRLRDAVVALRQMELAYRTEVHGVDAVTKRQYDDAANRAYGQCVHLLARVASFGKSHAARLRALLNIDQISRNAAVRAILSVKDSNSAVEIVEESCGIFWSQALRLRPTGLDGVPQKDQEALRKLFAALEHEQDVRSTDGIESFETQLREKRQEKQRLMGEQAEALIGTIRERPGMDRFLMAPTCSSLTESLPVGGFLVMLIDSGLGPHAMVLNRFSKDTGGTKSLCLTSLHGHSGFNVRAVLDSLPRGSSVVNDGCEAQDEQRTEAPDHEEQTSEIRGLRTTRKTVTTFEDTLGKLWRYIVKPIIHALGLKKAVARDRPRVWWCATGDFSFLPLHAAGLYPGENQQHESASVECVADYFVSSYLPTVSSLAQVRKDRRPLARSSINGLLVHEATPGRHYNALPEVQEEARTVAECLAAAGVTLVNDASTPPTVSSTLASLKDADVNILHLACHGLQKRDPLKSAFILRDGDLSIQDLMRLDLRHASLAFLSACETAKRSELWTDQAVHLAASMLFCGFKSVIATMWSMADVDGPVVARSFYSAIFKQDVFDLDDVPYALDDAVRELREAGVPASRWALFVHMGG